MASIKLTSLTKKFGDITAVDNMNLEIKDKEFFILLGPTGAGKTTTLRLIAGLEKQDKGEVYIDNVCVDNLSPALRDVSFVFQYYTLYPNYTVRQNLEFPLKSKLRKYSKEEIDKKVSEVSKILHIEHLLDRETIHLSGGEMQRVGIGRAIVRRPKVFLMDEPLSNLDAKLREEMRSELKRLHFDLGSTFLYVTHDQIEAMTMADRIGVLNDGKILQIGTPDEIYKNPKNIFVAKFVGSPTINIFDAVIQRDSLIIGKKDIVLDITPIKNRILKNYNKENIILGIRPEDIVISREKKDSNSFQCDVYFTQSMGSEDILNLKIGNVNFRAVSLPKLAIKLGEKVYAQVNANKLYLFDRDTENCIA